MLSMWWRLCRGHRLRPWRSPYLRWRIETYWGIPAESLGFAGFWRFLWQHAGELRRYDRWRRSMLAETGLLHRGVHGRDWEAEGRHGVEVSGDALGVSGGVVDDLKR